jgi:hypothetical protein
MTSMSRLGHGWVDEPEVLLAQIAAAPAVGGADHLVVVVAATELISGIPGSCIGL